MKLIFAGTPDFSVPALQALVDNGYDICAVYTQPDRPAGRGRQLRPSPVKQLALEHGITVQQPDNFKQAETVDQLRAYQADAMIVVAYGLILPQTVLDAPKLGCINIHASLLPRWRGAAPIQRAILAGDAATGITLMQMDAGLDTGDMLSQITCPITASETGQTLHDKLAKLGADALIDLLPKLASGKLQPEKQDEATACYAQKLSKQEGNIDWQQHAQQIERQIRAFNPWPSAFSHLNDQPLRIWQARSTRAQTEQLPGTLSVRNKRLFVACGQGSELEIMHLQPAGKKAMNSSAYLAAHQPDGIVLRQQIG